MHCLSPKMVCETKIVAEDHESIPGSKKDTIIVSSSQMWPSLAGSPPSPPPPLTPPKEDPRRDNVYIREFHPSEQEVVRRIFYEGIMERIPNTAFRGLKQQPLTQLLYGLLAVMCFVVTKSFLLTCCLPIFLMGMRYYFSRKVILHYLDCALHTDMSDIEQYYMKPPGEMQLFSQTRHKAISGFGLCLVIPGSLCPPLECSAAGSHSHPEHGVHIHIEDKSRGMPGQSAGG
ncbi:hypothetical protein Nmel_007418 [Mimus melanotis]